LKNPSVLFDARLVLEKPTGIGTYISSLIPEIVRLAPDLHVHLLRRPNPWSGYVIQNWQSPNLTQHISTLPHMTLRQHRYLPQLARQLKVDLIHYPHFDAPVFFGSIPVISTIYDAKYLIRPDFFTRLSSLKRIYMRFSYAQTLKRAAAVIAISQATAFDLQSLFQVVPDQVHVTHLAAAAQFQVTTTDKMAQLRQVYQLSRPFILSVSELRPHKNHTGLIQAYAQSQSRRSHDLVIIGQKYQDYHEPEECTHKLGLSNQVHFLTSVNNTDLVAFYNVADLFVLVSFYEGFGLPVLEAMACGTPVIATQTTAIGEVTGEGGFCVDPQNTPQITAAIDQILHNTNLRQQLIERGHQWRQRFSWQQTARKTLGVYNQILKQASGSI